MDKDDYLESFLLEAATIFREGEKTESGLRSSLARYLGLGITQGLSQGELIDFLGVSTPSVLDVAGYSDSEQEAAMTVLGVLSDVEIQHYVSKNA
jgi:hypothetical protein